MMLDGFRLISLRWIQTDFSQMDSDWLIDQPWDGPVGLCWERMPNRDQCRQGHAGISSKQSKQARVTQRSLRNKLVMIWSNKKLNFSIALKGSFPRVTWLGSRLARYFRMKVRTPYIRWKEKDALHLDEKKGEDFSTYLFDSWLQHHRSRQLRHSVAQRGAAHRENQVDQKSGVKYF